MHRYADDIQVYAYTAADDAEHCVVTRTALNAAAGPDYNSLPSHLQEADFFRTMDSGGR